MQFFDIEDDRPDVSKHCLENPMLFTANYWNIADLHTAPGRNSSMDRVNFPDKTV